MQAWFFLSVVCRFVDITSGDFAADAFNQILSLQSSEGINVQVLHHVLQTLVSICMRLSKEKIEGLHSQVLSLLKAFVLPLELIPVARDVVIAATRKMSTVEDVEPALVIWSSEIVKLCDLYLSEKILKNSSDGRRSPAFEEGILKRLITLGDLAQLCPGKVSSRVCVAVQSIVFPTDGNSSVSSSQPIPSSQIPSSQPVMCSFNPSPILQSAGLLTLGKLCLQNEKLAKQVVPALGKLLGSSSEPALKNNIVHVLCDIIIRYASLADSLMFHVLLCLKDNHIQVRRTTLSLLIGLFQEDYLKLRDNFFYKILQMVIDEDPKMKEMAVYYITQRLLPRKPKILSQHFVESIFHFNGHQEHAAFNRFDQSEEEKRLFCISGDLKSNLRFRIYTFMLDHLTDSERLIILYRICMDILKPFYEGIMTIPNQKTEAVLQDALRLIACKEIKLSAIRGGKPANDDHEGEEERQAVVEAVSKTVLTNLTKKNYIENIIPIIVKVKHELEKKKSPLLGDLMNCLKEIVKDYKNEVSEFFAADRQLATEVQYDLKKYEEECTRKEEEERIAAEQRERRRSKRRTDVSLDITLANEGAEIVNSPYEEEPVGNTIQPQNCAMEIDNNPCTNTPPHDNGDKEPPLPVQASRSELVKGFCDEKRNLLISTPVHNLTRNDSFLRNEDISVINRTSSADIGTSVLHTPLSAVHVKEESEERDISENSSSPQVKTRRKRTSVSEKNKIQDDEPMPRPLRTTSRRQK
ncbi:condensin-2 complex subunit D3-L-like [Artemia franciscana]|uniref:condensin-2 complex subunit D3-L-like n=1 Tax=Artemia franciscana TaxID=6661 RepID=UPI0032D9E768